jgi:hypothetical protein
MMMGWLVVPAVTVLLDGGDLGGKERLAVPVVTLITLPNLSNEIILTTLKEFVAFFGDARQAVVAVAFFEPRERPTAG